MAYRVLPYTKEDTPTNTAASPPQEDMSVRLEKLEQAIKSLTENGGKFNGLL